MTLITSDTSEAVLERETAQAIAEHTADDRTREAARAWLSAYDVARSLGFTEAVAQNQAALAWHLARTAPTLVWPDVP